MPPISLKTYQQAALDTLAAFARAARVKGPVSAFSELAGRPWHAGAFGDDLPCVCLRIPTGGGKTVLAAHAVPLLAREWAAVDAPVTVWLVPSDAIRQQTLKALQTPGHPYRAALADAYGEGLRVCVLEDVAQIAPPEWGRNAIVVVASIQSFRIEDAGQRNVYSFSESFEPHFRGVDERALGRLRELPDALVTHEDVERDATGVLAGFAGQPRWSLANWLALHQPLLIVDEAHTAKTDKSFTALQRLNPSFILELTATPIAAKTNVLYHVSAQELAAEDMIKLPIVLAEHPEGWPAAVFGAVQTQRKLEAEALKDEAAGAGYVRPIVLFQAQNAGEEMPPEKLRDYLVDELKLPAHQVVVATGKERGLDDIPLAARDCPVRYVITVQALREGWDCPFAYVLCSLQKLSSATAVEQLLGRVLRMPYAARRGREALNRAYAHVCAAEFSQAAHALADRLIEHMGFEALDVASMIAPPSSLPLWDNDLEKNQAPAPIQQAPIATNFEAIAASPKLLALPGVQQRAIAGVQQVVVTGHIGQDTEALLLAQVRGAKKQEQVREKVARHNALVATQAAPASHNVPFAPLPTLGYRLDAQAPLWPLEREAVLEAVELDLLTPQAVQLPSFQAAQESDIFEIGMDGARVALRRAGSAQMAMDWESSSITADTLVGWLDQSLFKTPELAGLTQSRRRAWLAAVVNHQLHGCGVPLVVLAQARFRLARAIEAHVADLRDAATRRAFQQQVLGQGQGTPWLIEPDWAHPHVFEPGRYPAPEASRYGGRYQFGKHYFPVLADLKEGGQEFQCAQLIDRHPRVRHWLRNLDTAPCGFGLPTSRGRFYADFVAELVDGRVALLEFKGAHLQNDPYEIEKRQVGELWARASGGRAVFGWLTIDGLAQQLDAALA
ncbi:DEAD/DEAH box helicase family protein [Diaphorobacter sp. MNS-0]|uniref:DEAD/DEAH box helicase family protein n=1 Tax=Diaphorobacter sp. MNS-0 TaxID=2866628 RepID=UPI001C730925|nr:DEAD/DEAH box helicase family protein [Diaphorobacter sp. MNS-0]QYY25566.1 DEAD/DEAH box helicase family protein [Diaphorobacter sp. MNS-0]